MATRITLVTGVVAGCLMLQGCASGVGLTMFGIGAGSATDVGVEHTLNGIVYKTFAASVDQVHAASRGALAGMAIKVTGDKRNAGGRTLLAKAADRDIEIRLERLTPRTTRMRVIVSEDVLLKDSATATEIILQTADQLDSRRAVASARR